MNGEEVRGGGSVTSFGKVVANMGSLSRFTHRGKVRGVVVNSREIGWGWEGCT